ncbi:cAMP-regulated phosphoprotein 19-A-like protein [Leptotrombidium deliense]|uniref:cAMP-regulated phosphoprotein 19-A-like protein n=1 Tax=Leptotrombidium deliense TaxID=299467 RepID=A0A443SHQ2_9ACAR|nr:cAMP-regulated phosphoprotein 19-A-like protein [Leptotrombidium deliense]
MLFQEELQKAEKEEEAKLKAKYPSVVRPGPQLLQKRLQKGQKYFDSGDYNMAKAATKNNKTRLPVSTLSQQPCAPPQQPPPTGDTIPTPDCLPTRKTSIHVQSKLAAGSP